MRVRLRVLFVGAVLAFLQAAAGQQLVVLQDTGRLEGNLPVAGAYPAAKQVEAALNRGFSARLLRLDYLVQRRLHMRGKGPEPEPVYLILGRRQGGFPREGFVLNGQAKRWSRWVDLPKSRRLTGSWGTMDQIFPHELAHVIMARLASSDALRVPVQTHAVGVRTTPWLAFQEGFGEHAQIMAIDDPSADSSTAALAKDPYWRARAERDLAAYRRELEARLSVGSPMRMTFPLWFSGDEQILRYHAVKANAFARRPSVPKALTSAADPYGAYLLDRVLHGSPQNPPRSAAQMAATEGVVSHLFWRWVNSPEIGRTLREPSFYASFGVNPQQLDPVDNVYLKIFAVVEESQPADLPVLVRAYETRFPDERPWLDQLVNDSLLGQSLPTSPNLWIVNPAWQVGTTLFDQWRAVPQPHCFDLNAADAVDLATIPGVSPTLAQAIQDGAPYNSLADLARVPGMTEVVLASFRSLEYVSTRGAEDETQLVSRLRPMLLAYVWRALIVWLCAALFGALMVWTVEPWGFFRAFLRGAFASGVALFVIWIGPLGISGGIWLAFALLAIPAFLWRLRSRVARGIPVRPQLLGISPSVRGILVWGAALLPVWVLCRPWKLV